MHRLLAHLVALLVLFVTHSASALEPGARAPNIGLADLHGNTTDIPSGKIVLVDIWASWCAPCKKELPALQRLYKRYRSRGFHIIAVNIDKDRSAAEEFLHGHPVSFPVVHDKEGSVPKRYAPKSMPSSYMIDTHGIVRHVYSGYHAGDELKLERDLKKLLPSPEPNASKAAETTAAAAPTPEVDSALVTAAALPGPELPDAKSTPPSTPEATTAPDASAQTKAPSAPPSASPSPAGRHAGLCTINDAAARAPCRASAWLVACSLLVFARRRRRSHQQDR